MARKMTLRATIDEALMEMEREAQERESYSRYCSECPYDNICDYSRETCLEMAEMEEMQALYEEEHDYYNEVESGLQDYRKAKPTITLLFATLDEDESYAVITETQLIGAFATKEEVEKAKAFARKNLLKDYELFSEDNEVTITFKEKEVALGDLAVGKEAIIAGACYIE